MTPVFLTIDAEFAWRHHAAGLAVEDICARSLEPAGVGIGYQLARLKAYGLKATFFVDPMPALAYGLDVVRRLVGTVLEAGQEVQLHCHPQWAGADPSDRSRHALFYLTEYDGAAQADMIAAAAELLLAAGAPAPVAFRAGGFGADDATLAALAALGFDYDASHNGAARPWPSRIGLADDHIAPVPRSGVVEVPVTLIADRPGRWRPLQLCAVSTAEMRAALKHALAEDHGALTLVTHSFELATRDGTQANTMHVRRFEALCSLLAEHADAAPTTRFSDRPALRLGQDDRPLGPHRLRATWRRAEQLWSNVLDRRAA